MTPESSNAPWPPKMSSALFPLLLLLSASSIPSSSALSTVSTQYLDGLTGFNAGGAVYATTERHLPVSPSEARDAWMDYAWKGGGGLPLLVMKLGKKSEDEFRRRFLSPVMVEEVLKGDSWKTPGGAVGSRYGQSIEYGVADAGIFSMEMYKRTHSGSVNFRPGENGGSVMNWDVQVEAAHRASLWQKAFQANIDYVSDGLEAYIAVPQLYRRWTRILGAAGQDATEVAREWVDFCFYGGGGLPSPPPVRLGDGLTMRIPPFLLERMTLLDGDANEVRYGAKNPGLFTYQVHSHAGKVTFTDMARGEVMMLWEVEIRPYGGWKPYVKSITSMAVSTMARDFKSHLEEPGAKVALKLPRGKGEPLLQIPKSSWVGGVLDTHLRDGRSAREQAVDFFMPWTWGRTTDGEGEGEEWTEGYLDGGLLL